MNDLEERIRNRREDINRIADMIVEFGALHHLAKADIHDLNVAADEVLSNIIAYGYPQQVRGEIIVRMTCQAGEVLLDIEDDGQPFDPRQAPAPDLSSTPESRRPGGLGIHFVRELMDDVLYARTAGKNHLQLRKKIRPA